MDVHRSLVGLCLALVVILALALPACAQATEEAEQIPFQRSHYPAWSPDGQHIAFQSRSGEESSDVWLIHPNGTSLERVTSDPAVDVRPKWTPNSSSLYFLSFRGGDRRLWKRVLATGAETQVTQGIVWEYAVSHNGQYLVVETSHLKIISAATGADVRWLEFNKYPGSNPTWSPDDQEVAFVRQGNVWVRNALDLSNLRQITTFTHDERLMGRPGWGSGGFIAFDLDGKIYKVRPDGTDLACVFEDPDPENWAESPSWSPDGAKLVFVRSLEDSQELWIINADGTGLTQLTHTAAKPAFDPDEGTYTGSQSVTISCSSPGVTIRYTTDGSDPTESSTQYTEPVTVDHSLTLKARAWKTGWFPSIVKTADYVIE